MAFLAGAASIINSLQQNGLRVIMERKIPKVMATQHPDNATKPYWLHSGKFVDTKNEVEECFHSFSDLKCDEYMWDWEGKHVDEAVMERLLEKHMDFFSKKQLGRDVFLTFRIPNFWLEEGYRVARAFVNIVSANDLAIDYGLHTPPVFEAILPMTTSGEQPYQIRKKYSQLAASLKGFGEAGPEDIEVIPLIEAPANMFAAGQILSDYLKLCKSDSKLSKRKLAHLRPFIARSDPALNSGVVPAILAAKAGIQKCHEFGESNGLEIHPIIGVGSLPFRGWLSPSTVEEFCKEYPGVRTATVQPSFCYDHSKEEVNAAISKLSKRLTLPPSEFSKEDLAKFSKLAEMFEKHYQKTIEGIAEDINKVAKAVPARRERRLHVGLFGYSRKIGSTKLPRAIAYTASMYSLGVPPELVGLGRGIEQARRDGLLKFLEENIVTLRKIAVFAGNYLNKQNLSSLAAANPYWKAVEQDVKLIEEWLGQPLGPAEPAHQEHFNLSSNVLLLLKENKPAGEEIERLAELRKTLG